MRPRIKTIKSEKVFSTNVVERYKVQHAEEILVKMRKDSLNLPSELPDVIKGGLIFEI